MNNSPTSSQMSPEQEKNAQTVETPNTPPRFIVGIGASAGGLDALQSFFDNMPADSGLAFVVIQHLSPDYKSLMVELLSKHTKMEVRRTEDKDKIRRNCIYLIPPKKNITILNNHLYLNDQPERHTLNLPIDIFFRSLAEDMGERAIAIVLSGTGSDGTRGIRAIKEEGGFVFVQNEGSAQFDGMPKSAISTGLADFILSPEEIPQQLLRFLSHPFIATNKPQDELLETDDDGFARLMRLLLSRLKVDFSHYKPATVVRRIERRMGIVQVSNLNDYLRFINKYPGELTALFKDLLIGVTKFFRDSSAFTLLEKEAIPKIFKECQKRPDKTLRVWTSACSTGEEAYSIAMLLMDYAEKNCPDVQIKVFATDIDRDAIEFAGTGLYPESIVADVDIELFRKYFTRRKDGYQVNQKIRELVVFALQNLLRDPPFTRMDLISCRNLLIYLEPIMQRKVLSIFNYSLVPTGYLFLGSSETIGDLGDSFDPVDLKNRLYKHRGKGSLPLRDETIVPMLRNAVNFKGYQLPTQQKGYTYGGDSNSFDQLERYYHDLIRTTVPTVLVLSETRELLQSFGNSRRYLRVPHGNVTLDVLAMLPRELSLAISSAIHKVRKTQSALIYNNIRVREEDETSHVVTVKVDSITDNNRQSSVFVISIFDHDFLGYNVPSHQESSTEADARMEGRICDLEQEVQFTRENLQATIEELQTANEELQATNEELLAANEELQSTNEELQSVNEELNTVNTEYQEKNIELQELNNDMRNLMNSTNIGTLFLSRDLRIRKYTPAMTRVINLLEQDIGRPISDLASPLVNDALIEDLKTVARTLQASERQVETTNEFYIQRLLPFINELGEFDGLVVTLIQITKQITVEQAFRLQQDTIQQIMANIPASILVAERDGTISYVNHYAQLELNVPRSSLEKAKLDEPPLLFTDLKDKKLQLGQIIKDSVFTSGVTHENIIVCHNNGRGYKLDDIYKVAIVPIFTADKRVETVVIKLDPVARRNTTSATLPKEEDV